MKEFKKFITRGSVLDMAVGLILATYFGSIVKSLVNDILMPPIGLLMGGIDFSELKIVLKNATFDLPELAIYYGVFLNSILTFIIVSFSVYLVVKAYHKAKARTEKNEKENAIDPKPPKQEVLLEEIRDLFTQ